MTVEPNRTEGNRMALSSGQLADHVVYLGRKLQAAEQMIPLAEELLEQLDRGFTPDGDLISRLEAAMRAWHD